MQKFSLVSSIFYLNEMNNFIWRNTGAEGDEAIKQREIFLVSYSPFRPNFWRLEYTIY